MGQIGGSTSFNALNLINNARSAGLGARVVSLSDGDLTQFVDNPATLDSVRKSEVAFMINPYFVDVNIFNGAASFKVKDFTVGIGITYLSYGDFDLLDDVGTDLGTFQANDYQMVAGVSHRIGPFALGLNLKYVNTTIYDFTASAAAVDIGGLFYVNPNWTVGMVIENVGATLSDPIGNLKLPFDVKIGTTFKPTYMPFRFTLTTNRINNSNQSIQEASLDLPDNLVDRMLRSVSIGTEVLFSKNFQLLFGYNHNRKQELKLEQIGGGAGFSYGLAMKINRFRLRFSRMTYHAAGGTSFISVQTNLDDFKKIL